MAKTSAERVQAFRLRQAALIVSLRRALEGAGRQIEAMSNELAEARAEVERLSSGGASRCRRHQKVLLCEDCYRERHGDGDF